MPSCQSVKAKTNCHPERSEGSRMAALVILSVSEESRMVTLAVLTTGSFTAARFRMTGYF